MKVIEANKFGTYTSIDAIIKNQDNELKIEQKGGEL